MTAQHTNVKDQLLKEGRIVEEKELFKTTYRGKELKLVRLAIQKNGETKYKYIGYIPIPINEAAVIINNLPLGL